MKRPVMRALWATTAATVVLLGGPPVLADGQVIAWIAGEPIEDGFREPAAVELLTDGALVVADSAADSVTAFDATGALRWRLDEGLNHPSGLGVAKAGVWVADTGHDRLLLLSGDRGQIVKEVHLDSDLLPTDVAVASDGRLWVSATPRDRIVILDADLQVETVITRVGGEPIRAPRGLLPDISGAMLVTEVLAGRVLRLGPDGALLAVLADWGLSEGTFVKPKDLARLPDGGIVVVDSHQGIAQILNADGSFRQLVSSTDDFVRLDHPLGVAAGTDELFVADAGVAAVRVLRGRGPAWKEGRFPAEEFVFRQGSVRDEDPSRTCRQCHDGTRRLGGGQWDPQAIHHPVDFKPSEELPARLKRREDGGLACTSCHLVHPHEQAGGDAVGGGDIVTLGLSSGEAPPVAGLDSSACIECHVDHLDVERPGQRHSHPVRVALPDDMDRDLFIEAGGQLDGGQVVCLTCHDFHGARAEGQLVLEARDGRLCLGCHADQGPGRSVHPIDIEVSNAEAGSIRSVGGVLSLSGTLTCLSCHDPHESTSGSLLRTSGAGAAACRSCHANVAWTLQAGGHADAGCEGCHGMHSAAPSRPGHGNVEACRDCHASGGDAPQVDVHAMHPLDVALEPGSYGSLPTLPGRMLGCVTCHDAHGRDARLLRGGDVGVLCVTCHDDKATVQGTDHDASVVAVGDTTDTCLSCHEAHGSSRTYLFGPTPAGQNPASARCLSCHDGSTEATKVGFFQHPPGLLLNSKGLPFRYEGNVPYYGPDGEPTEDRATGEITCLTCHDPHRWRHDSADRPGAANGDERSSFLKDPGELIDFCAVCHGVEGRPKFRFFHTDRVRGDNEGDTP